MLCIIGLLYLKGRFKHALWQDMNCGRSQRMVTYGSGLSESSIELALSKISSLKLYHMLPSESNPVLKKGILRVKVKMSAQNRDYLEDVNWTS